MRDKMPQTAAFIDSLRKAFGREGIDRSIKRGIKGEEGWFHAVESGHQVGTPFAERDWVVPRRPPKGKP